MGTNGSIGGNLTVTGTSTLSSTTEVGASLIVQGNLEICASSAKRLCVTSSCTTTTNNTCIDGTVCVTGAAAIGGNTAVDGCITATADIIAFSSSDKRYKNNLNKICNTKEIINGLTGYSFEWNKTSGREGNDLGVIAQDVKEVLPEIVQERKDGYLAVDYPKLIPVLIEEVKRLGKEVEELKRIK